MNRITIGIDEAGRGPLAGPVSVGACLIPLGFDTNLVHGATDSKKMTEKARERIYAVMCDLRTKGLIDFAVSFSSAAMIDEIGIVSSIQKALNETLMRVCPHSTDTLILLDGGLHAPEQYTNQKTIIRGDQSELPISLASIAAKVERDHIMCKLAVQYPHYALEIHKGYGTKKHRELILKNGLSVIHRRSFCKSLQNTPSRL